MFLPDIIITAYNEGFSGIYVQCPRPIEAAEKFDQLFLEAYIKAMDDLEDQEDRPVSEKYNNCPCPAASKALDDTQFLIRLAPLYLTLNDGTRVDNDYLLDAVLETLGKLGNEFHNMSYYGLISYEWFDEHCGDVVSVEVSSGNLVMENVAYPFVKEIFDTIFADEELSEEFWETIKNNIYDCTKEDIQAVIDCFKLYEQPEYITQKFLEIATDCDLED